MSDVRQFLERFLLKIGIDRATEYLGRKISLNFLMENFGILLTIFFVTVLFSAIFSFIEIHLINKIEVNATADLKRKYFSHLINLDYEFFTKHRTGLFVSCLSRDAAAIEKVTDSLFFEFFSLII